MNKILIVDASDSDCRLMSGLLTRAGYEPVIAEDIEAAKQEVTKLLPGAVINSEARWAKDCLGDEIPGRNYKREVPWAVGRKKQLA